MRRIRAILDLLRTSERDAAQGVLTFFCKHVGIFVDLDQESQHTKAPDRSLECDGLIVSASLPMFEAICRAYADRPIVAVCCGGTDGGIGWDGPRVETDDIRIGELGAEHLAKCGFRHLAFCGYPFHHQTAWSRERGLAFAKAISRHGRTCELHICRHDPTGAPEQLNAELEAWLGALPKPIGIMAADDRMAHRVVRACRELGLAVPEEVAILGVNNDALMGSLATDFLSSIDLAATKLGYEAASLLYQLMEGEPVGQVGQKMQPLDVIRRRSTDTFAVDDAEVVRAARYIRRFASNRITAQDVADQVALSRSYLDTRFKGVFGYTVSQAIQKHRREHALGLLAGGELTIKQIVDQVGYSSTQHLNADIRRATGRTPGQYRKEAMAKDPPPTMSA